MHWLREMGAVEAVSSLILLLPSKQMMNNMGGDEGVDLPEVDGADDVSS